MGDGTVSAAVWNDALEFPPEMEGYLSVFCAGGTAKGVTLSGLKYELEDAELTNTFPLGVSNEFVGVPARVSVKDGALLVLWQGENVEDALLRTR